MIPSLRQLIKVHKKNADYIWLLISVNSYCSFWDMFYHFTVLFCQIVDKVEAFL